MACDIKLWCRQCVPCQRGKVYRHASKPITAIPVPELPFSAVHIDLVGPFPSGDGFKYLFTIIDRTTRWPEAVPVRDMSTASFAAAFITSWVSRHGVPAVITSDRGAQFCSTFWREFCSLLGIKHNLTTAYHPMANGLVERFHRSLKNSLRSRLAGSNWVSHLPWVMLGLRTAPREESGVSVAQNVFATPLSLTSQFLSDESFGELLRRRIAGMPAVPVKHNREAASSLLKELDSTKHIFIRTDSLVVPPLEPRYQGPFLVLEKKPDYFVVQMGDRTEKVNLQRLKPAYITDDVPLALPPRRGRPTKR